MLRFGSALLSCGGPGTFAWIRPMQNAGFLLLLLVQPATLWLQHWQQVDKQLLSLSHLFFSALFSAYLFSPFPRFVLLRAGFLLLLHLHFSFAATTTKATTKQLVFCMNVGLFVCASACVCVCSMHVHEVLHWKICIYPVARVLRPPSTSSINRLTGTGEFLAPFFHSPFPCCCCCCCPFTFRFRVLFLFF